MEWSDIRPRSRLASPVADLLQSLAAGVQRDLDGFSTHGDCSGKFHEDAADLFDLFVLVEDVLVAQKVAKAQLLGFRFGAGVERAILRPQLFGGVAFHPEGLFVGHCRFRPWGRESWLVPAFEPAYKQASKEQFQCRWPETDILLQSMELANLRKRTARARRETFCRSGGPWLLYGRVCSRYLTAESAEFAEHTNLVSQFTKIS